MNDKRPHGTRLGDRRVAEPRREAEHHLFLAERSIIGIASALAEDPNGVELHLDGLRHAVAMRRKAEEMLNK